MSRLNNLKSSITTKPYSYIFIISTIIYLAINTYLNQLYISLENVLSYNLYFIVPFIALTLLVSLLVGANISLAVIKIRELKQISKASGLTLVGTFGGILGGACPGCFVGLFPAFLGLFGATATLGNLPLYGIEIQLISAGLLLISLFLLTKDTTCKV